MRLESRRDTACSRPPEGTGGNVCLQIYNPNKLKPTASEVASSNNFLFLKSFYFPEDWTPAPSDPDPPAALGATRLWNFLKICVCFHLHQSLTVTSYPLHWFSFCVFSICFSLRPCLCLRGLHFSRVLVSSFGTLGAFWKNKKKKRKGKTRHVLLSDLLLLCCSEAVKKLRRHK